MGIFLVSLFTLVLAADIVVAIVDRKKSRKEDKDNVGTA